MSKWLYNNNINVVNKIEKQDMRDRENESIFLLW
jgi:hypothetical protein